MNTEGAGQYHYKATLHELGPGNQERIPRTERNPMSLLSSRRARRRIQGTTGQSASSWSFRKLTEQPVLETISRHIKHKKVTGSSQHRFVKGKSCLTKLITFYNEVSSLDGQRESS